VLCDLFILVIIYDIHFMSVRLWSLIQYLIWNVKIDFNNFNKLHFFL